MTSYHTADVDGNKIFYREAGAKTAPTVLLLHGFPTSSHMFRNLIPILGERYHIVAPDLPGFGFSDSPDRKQFAYTFENLAKAIHKFTHAVGLNRYALYVFDYGAPVGLRLALAHAEKVTAIISQNGNAYEEGLSEGWKALPAYRREPEFRTGCAEPHLAAVESRDCRVVSDFGPDLLAFRIQDWLFDLMALFGQSVVSLEHDFVGYARGF